MRSDVRIGSVLAVACLLLFSCGRALTAQSTAGQYATRAQLEAQQQELQRQLAELTASGRQADSANVIQSRLTFLHQRLADGDFQPNDVIQVNVRGFIDTTASFTLNQQREIVLPNIPQPVSLAGVLYSEAEGTLTQALSVYLRDPEVKVTVTKRLLVNGGVGSPGFYDLPPTTTVSQVIMSAGGPAAGAKLSKTVLRRAGTSITDEYGEIAFANVTLAELGAQAGDELYVPPAGSGISAKKIMAGVGSLAGLVFLINRITR